MQLRELELRNFRRFERAQIEFPDGVVGILGPNGAGKSTLVEAIGWVLYGHDAARTTKDEIRRQGSDDDVHAALEFTLGDHAYRVVRMMKGKNLTAQARLVVDGSEQVPGGAKSAGEVTDRVEQLLGMDREAFFTSIVAKQNELDMLSSMTPGRRKEVLLRMLNVDDVDDAIERVRRDRRQVESRIETLESQLVDPDELAKERQSLRQETRALEAKLDRLDERKSELSDRVDELKARRQDLEEDKERHADATARLESLTERLADLEDDRDKLDRQIERARRADSKLDDLGDVDAELSALEERFEALDERRDQASTADQLRQRRSTLASKLDDLDVDPELGDELEADLREAEDALEEVQDERRRIENLLDRLDRDRDRRTDRRDELADRLETFDELGPDSPCPTCHRPLEEAHPDLVETTRGELQEVETRIERIDDRVAKGRSDLEGLRDREADLEERVETLADDLEAWRADRSKAETLADELDDVDAELETIGDVDFDADAYEQVKEDLETARSKRRRVAKLEERADQLDQLLDERDQLETALDEVEEQIADAEETIDATEAAATDHAEVVDTLDEVQDDLQTVLTERGDLEGERSRLQAERERLQEREEEIEETREQVRELRTRRRYLLRLAGKRDSGLLPDFRRHLIARVRPALAETASALFTSLTDGRYTDLDLDEEYELRIRDGDDVYGQDRFSGGEVDLANLCLRLAVGRLIAERGGQAGLDVVVLDEVFGSQDRSRRDNILRTLQTLTGQFRQILVITHIDDVKERLEHVLQVRQDGGVSRVEWEG